MALPGRRRPDWHPVLFLLLLLAILTSTVSAASAVLGIDLGTEYIKAALVKPGIPLEIVLTKDSKRKEAATLAFKPAQSSGTDVEALPERLYGGDANALAARFPNHVYPNLKALLGAEASSTVLEDYEKRYTGLSVEPVVRNQSSKQGTVGFRNQALDDGETPFLVEELLAMELRNIKMNAEAAAGGGSEITDVVLTIPPFYTAEETRALEIAADLAGLRVLGLISDGLAVGLNYATSRTFPSISEGGKPEFHLVYDMGAGSTTATVLRFQGRAVKDIGRRNKTIQEVQVMSTKWQKDLGGDAWNKVVVDDMIKKLSEMPQIKSSGFLLHHIGESAKTMARLWKEAERMRQVLSANTQTSTTLEGLFLDDIVFKYQLSRAEFEELTLYFASQVSIPLTEVLDAAGVTIQSLDSVILHGGAVRTPFVQKQLEAVAGSPSKIRTNVNADEAAVLGAAFRAAGMSPSFRVKDIRADDTTGFGVWLKWTADGKERTQNLFTPGSAIGTEKPVPFAVHEDFALEISQVVEDRDVPVFEVRTLNLTASHSRLQEEYHCAPVNISTKLAMRLSPLDGLPETVSGSVSCETEIIKAEGGVMDNVKGLFGFGSKKTEEQEPLRADEADNSRDESSTAQTSASVDEKESSTVSPTTKSTTNKSSSPSASTINIPISFTTRPLGVSSPLSPDLLSRIRSRLVKFDLSDRARLLRAEALNSLESFTYRARDLISDPDFVAYASQVVLDKLEQQMVDTSEWLYGDGVDAKLADFKARLKDLQGLVDPVMKRRDEASKRDGAIQRLEDGLGQMKGMIDMVEHSVQQAKEDYSRAEAEAEKRVEGETTEPSSTETRSDTPAEEADKHEDLDDDPYSTSTTTPTSPSSSPSSIISPYSPADLESLQSTYSSVLTWLSTQREQQNQLAPTVDPVLLVADLDAKATELQERIRRLVAKNIHLPKQKPAGGAKKATTAKAKDKANKNKTDVVGETVSSPSTSPAGSTVGTDAESKTQTRSTGPKDEL